MILENITDTFVKQVYIVNLETDHDILTIGRGHEREIRIPDISVSRMHSKIIKTKDHELILQDAGAKFGTLVKVRRPICLNKAIKSNHSIVFQSGRSVLEVR